MTPQELIFELVKKVGPCMRICAYCPEDFKTAEVKECVEGMVREIYSLRAELDEIKQAYKEKTGEEYEG